MNTTEKPPYSKDGRLQLCSRCQEYCSRVLNMCPTCTPYKSPRYQQLAARLIEENRLREPPEECRHLIGIDGRNNGFFIVNNDGGCLNRETYRQINRAAKRFGLSKTLFIYGRVCSYFGPGIEFMQLCGNE